MMKIYVIHVNDDGELYLMGHAYRTLEAAQGKVVETIRRRMEEGKEVESHDIEWEHDTVDEWTTGCHIDGFDTYFTVHEALLQGD